MEFVGIVTEQTTAATDALLAIVAVAASFVLRHLGHARRWKVRLWGWLFALLAGAGLLGAIAHGLVLDASLEKRLWIVLNLCLGLTVAIFAAAVTHDLFGAIRSRQVLPYLLATGAGFWGLTLLSDRFLLFIVYATCAMGYALVGYLRLAVGRRLPGAWLMATGVAVSILAALVQASGAVAFTLVWEFDHNGAYHLLQLVGLAFLIAGLRRDLLADRRGSR